jgi:hypothetical protein
MNSICRKCDLYVGYGGAGVFKPPPDKDPKWLASHCWSCGRSNEEIREVNEKYDSGELNAR